MKRRLIALLLVFALLCPLLAVGAAADYTVYITDTGEKYHNYGCRYLSESCRPISASSARAMGYTPCSVCNAPVAEPEQTGFVDVAPNKYYSEAVDWAVEKGITNGLDKSHFGPQQACTRGQIVTFLWRAAGEPTVDAGMTFDDVHYGDYCYNAVRWAVKNGITKGTSSTKFSPQQPCTRGQVVTFLYRAEGSPDVGNVCRFSDVAEDSFCRSAVIWAVANNITNGKTETTFAPSEICNRAQIVTFLYRFYNQPTPTPTPTPTPAPTPTTPVSSDHIVSGKLPYPCPEPLSCVPAPEDEATHDNVLALLDNYCPNGAYILRATEIEGDNFMTWMENEALLDCIGTAVHEQSHGYTSHNMSYNGTWVMAYYTGEGKHIKVPQTETYLSEEMAAQIPEELRTFRYDTYVGKGAVVSANKRGIYGLMNEFTAYCWDTITNNSMYEYYLTQEQTEENWLNYVKISSSQYYAYSEFKYYILSYMLYAKENYPNIYEQTMNNRALLDAFRIIEARYRGAVEQYFANLDRLETYLKDNGIRVFRDKDMFYIGYFGYGTFEDKYYNLLENAMKAPEYVQMYKLMTK